MQARKVLGRLPITVQMAKIALQDVGGGAERLPKQACLDNLRSWKYLLLLRI
jgi:hypothetical protein